jgi:tRNA uridine 5-carbamoylmethylation protein Kti12
MLKDSPVTDYKVESIINNIIDNTIESAFESGFDVIVDNTNLKLSYINSYIKKYGELTEIYFKIHNIDYQELLIRDNNRDKKVGEEVLKRMYAQFIELMNNKQFINLCDTYPSL